MIVNTPKIYLCDLIHNAVFSKESYYIVPLNIGYIGAYLKGRLGNAVEVKLFKYPDKLIGALKEGLPDIIGFSYYTWNEELVSYIAKKVKGINPDVLIAIGGPNIEVTSSYLDRFLKTHQYFDYYIPFEGEKAFAHMVESSLGIGNLKKIKQTEIEGAATYVDGLNYSPKEPDSHSGYIDYPSPYLTGIMDEFIKDAYLFPLFETNRGCPFSCTYCTWGSSARKHMRMWPLEQVFAEFEYVMKYGVNQGKWIFADSNFGIYERDIEIAERICSLSKRPSGVKSILAWISKNTTERNIKIAEILGKLNGFLVAFQTLDKEVLSNIKRHNITESSFVSLMNYFKSKEADVETDILIGLPGETYESHLTTLRKCFDYDLHYIRGMNIRLLAGSEMATEVSRSKFGIKTKYRLIKDSYGPYWNDLVIDCEEIVCSTEAMSENEMLKLRLIHFFIWLFWNNRVLQPLMLIGKYCSINPVDQILNLLSSKDSISPEYAIMLSNYMKEATEELFETKEDLLDYYYKMKDPRKLLEEFNFLNFKYSSVILFSRDIFLSMFNSLGTLIVSRDSAGAKEYDLEEIKKFTIARLCLDLENIDENRELTISKKAYEFLVKENIVTEAALYEKDVDHDHHILKLQLRGSNFIINELKSCGEEDKDSRSERIITKRFLRNLIYTA